MSIIPRLFQGIPALPTINFQDVADHHTSLNDYLREAFYKAKLYGGDKSEQIKLAGQFAYALRRTINNTAPPPKQDYRPITPPLGWHNEKISVAGTTVRFASTNIKDAKANIVFALGFGSETAYFAEKMIGFTQSGINIIPMELPENGSATHFPDGTPIEEKYVQTVAATIFNPNSPIHDHLHGNTTLLMTHSASGLASNINLMRSDTLCGVAAETFSSIIDTATMLDTAHSSVNFYPCFASLYYWYSQHENVRDWPLGTTEVDQLFIGKSLNLQPEQYLIGNHRVPTHGQANRLTRGGRPLVEDARDPNNISDAYRNLPRTMIGGLHDGGACTPTIKLFGNLTGAEVFIAKTAGHDVIGECDVTKRFIMRKVARDIRVANTIN